MIWNISFFASVLVLIAAVVLAAAGSRSVRIRSTFHVVFAGVFLAVYVGLIPMFVSMLDGEPAFLMKLLMFDVLQTIQVFVSEVSGDFILENINASTTAISGMYSTYMTCLFFAAPILTFGFLLSLFRNAWMSLWYRLRYWGDAYIFSELNEKALMLARSIRNNHPSSLIVFTDVDRNEGEIRTEVLEAARDLGALTFRKDIVSADFARRKKAAGLHFFAIGEQESGNLILALKLLAGYKERANTDLYVFSSGTEGDLLLAHADKGLVKVRRVNEVRSLIYRFLFDQGNEIFESANVSSDGTKTITAVVVGLGKYGTELVKALSWFCQMDGYRLSIHAFDADGQAEDVFAAEAPELSKSVEITIHAGVDVGTGAFAEELAGIRQPSYIFVCLGDDEKNISQSAYIRMLCERAGAAPQIRTIIYNTEEKDALKDVTNYRGQSYGIAAIGDLPTSYSEEVLLDSELEKLALQCHLKWGSEEEFWQYEYNYHSSMALAIHRKARIFCGIPGADKPEAQLTSGEREGIARLEHRRWNAYMRSEGYIGSEGARNDLGKMHPDIVDYEELGESSRSKLHHVGTL